MTGQIKDRIAAAFLTLIKQKNVDKISVKDLAEHCQIPGRLFLTFCTYGLFGLLLDHPAIDKEGSREKTTAQICRLLSRLLESPERS